MSSHELALQGCVKEHVQLALMDREGNSVAVISIAMELEQKGLLDKPSLEGEARAFYELGQFKKALDARVLSFGTPKKCAVFVDCRREWVGHYENAKYYRAAGYLDKAEEELKSGDLAFDKSCPRSNERNHECSGMRDRLLDYFMPKK